MTDTHNLFRNDVPILKLRDKRLLKHRKGSSAIQCILPFKVRYSNNRACSTDLRCRSGLGEDGKLTRNDLLGRKLTRVYLCRGDSGNLTVLCHTEFDVCSVLVIGQSAVYVVAQDRHQVRCLGHIGVSRCKCVIVGFKLFLELLVLHKGWEHRHHHGSSVALTGGANVVCNNIRSLFKDTDENVAVRIIVNSEVIFVRIL